MLIRYSNSAPKGIFSAALRRQADRIEKGGSPVLGQQELFQPNREPGDSKFADYYRQKADIVDRAPGKTTGEVYQKAARGKERVWSLARTLQVAGKATGVLAGLALGATGPVGAAIGTGLAIATVSHFAGDAVAGLSSKYCDRKNATSSTSTSIRVDSEFLGQEFLLADEVTQQGMLDAGYSPPSPRTDQSY